MLNFGPSVLIQLQNGELSSANELYLSIEELRRPDSPTRYRRPS